MPPITVVFFGISGSGKGTQADMLERFLGKRDPSRSVTRAEMGSLAREFMKTDTSLAKRTTDIVSSGGLLPSFIPVYLLISTDLLPAPNILFWTALAEGWINRVRRMISLVSMVVRVCTRL
ncbi:MAG: hypothetical protein UY57_C0036G0007 [Candidatus Kaiserbacteria bacterium GW2011_GWB1_50_17]|uniref:Adenylate kinase n=1 Tax=Candidatus Kaiserbacteria bacterium GW2011_GWB1_50_17 TaxID=1618673 RepID=A0A0G1WD36_9BACT|nr:MAG: hypothetical protein UY57_C0036G0007 [Candidatus Kaiserbacteria bacterium GW2011_GWB1_50_17]